MDGFPAEGRDGINLGTFGYRAPELLCGWPSFGPPVDAWSLGITLGEAAGHALTTGAATAAEMRAALTHQLGFRDHPELRNFPTPLASADAGLPYEPQPLPRCVLQRLGVLGCDLLLKLLRFPPSLRWLPAAVKKHPFLTPGSTVLSGLRRGTYVGPKKDEIGETQPLTFRRAPRGYGGLVPEFVPGPLAPSHGATSFLGDRHTFNIRGGTASPEVLAILQADAAFVHGSAAWDALQVDFQKKPSDQEPSRQEPSRPTALRKRARTTQQTPRQPKPKFKAHRKKKAAGKKEGKAAPKRPKAPRKKGRGRKEKKEPPSKSRTEENRKTLTAGWAHPSCATGGMCGLVLNEAVPLKTVRAWLAAWKRCNHATIETMVGLARSKVTALGAGADGYGDNGEHMLETSWQDWLFTPCEVQVTRPWQADTGYWQEPAHNDGGGSVLHLSITYFGRRDTRFSLASADPDIFVHSYPGVVYFGAFTGARHQVIHSPAPEDELLRAGDERLAVSVQCRTALFPYYRARNRETTPNPVAVFRALAWAFTAALETLPWHLPDASLVAEELATLEREE